MTDKPFHHGNLRSDLLARAEQTLRTDGLDALSLRELARAAGVSHAAPRRHFPDRQALLDALAERGFDELTAQLDAAGRRDGSYEDRFKAGAHAFVRFAVDNAALLDLMFTTKGTQTPPSLTAAAERFFAVAGAVVDEGARTGRLPLADPHRVQSLLVATLRGIATLVAAGRLPAAQVDTLVDDAAALFIRPARRRRPSGT